MPWQVFFKLKFRYIYFLKIVNLCWSNSLKASQSKGEIGEVQSNEHEQLKKLKISV
jgi:hypothetical protein